MLASYAHALQAHHAILLPHERLLKQTVRIQSFPFAHKDQLKITWKLL